MPNHITNCLEITHKDPKKIKWLKTCWDAERNGLDFNKIIPQPKNIFTGSLGDKERKLCEKEGRDNWYDWNIANWDTKWNSYDGKLYDFEDKFVCMFLTAWSPPEAIFNKLVEKGFSVKGLWKDEGDSEVHQIGEPDHDWYTNVDFDYGG